MSNKNIIHFDSFAAKRAQVTADILKEISNTYEEQLCKLGEIVMCTIIMMQIKLKAA